MVAENDTPIIVGTADTDWVHKCLGAGKAADILLWRKKKSVSAAALSLLTLVWYYVEVLETPLIVLLGWSIFIAYSFAFLIASGALNHAFRDFERPVSIPQVYLPHEPFVEVVLAIHTGVYSTLCLLRRFVVSKSLKKYILVSLFLSRSMSFGVRYSFGTFSYILIMLLFVVPLLLEKIIDVWEFYKCYKRWSGNHKEKGE